MSLSFQANLAQAKLPPKNQHEDARTDEAELFFRAALLIQHLIFLVLLSEDEETAESDEYVPHIEEFAISCLVAACQADPAAFTAVDNKDGTVTFTHVATQHEVVITK